MAEADTAKGTLWASAIVPGDGEQNLGECIDVMDLLPDFIIQEEFPKELHDNPKLVILDGPEDMWELFGLLEMSQVAKCLLMDDIHPQWEILHNHKLFARDAAVWLKRSVQQKVTTVKKPPAVKSRSNPFKKIKSGTHYIHSIITRQEEYCIPIRFYGKPVLGDIQKSLKTTTDVNHIKEKLDAANVVYDAPNILPKGKIRRVWYELRPLCTFNIERNDKADLEDFTKSLFRLHSTIKDIDEYTRSSLTMNFGNVDAIKSKCETLKGDKRKLSKKASFLDEEIIPRRSQKVDWCLKTLKDVEKTISSAMKVIKEVGPKDAIHSCCDPTIVESLKGRLPERALNVVVLGKTGAGKSETVNLLAGAPICKVSDKPQSETAFVNSTEIAVPTPIGKVKLNIIDTPGMFDTRSLDPRAILELRNVIKECPTGIDVVINTLRAGRFTKEEEDCLKAVQDAAGNGIFKHSIFVFTHGKDVLDNNSASQYMKDCATGCATSDKESTLSTLTKILEKQVSNRAVFIENKNIGEMGRMFQRSLILHHIYGVLNKNKCQAFSSAIVRQIQKEQEEAEQRLNEIKDREKEEEREEIEKLRKDSKALKKLKEDKDEKEKQEKEFKKELDKLATSALSEIKEKGMNKDKANKFIEEKRQHYLSTLPKKYPLLSYEYIKAAIDAKITEMKNSVKDAEKCFPSNAIVYTPRGEVEMHTLKHGDLVLGVGAGGKVEFSPILMFSHACPDVPAHYIKLHTENRKVLTLTPGHLLHVGEIGVLVPSDDVKPGDAVFTYEGGHLVPSAVVSVSEGSERGIYCPQTSSGSIIVDGVVSSCYTTFMAPRVAHALLLPARVLFRVLPLVAYNWLLPYDEGSGMPMLLNWSAKYVRGLKVPYWGGL